MTADSTRLQTCATCSGLLATGSRGSVGFGTGDFGITETTGPDVLTTLVTSGGVVVGGLAGLATTGVDVGGGVGSFSRSRGATGGGSGVEGLGADVTLAAGVEAVVGDSFEGAGGLSDGGVGGE